MRERISARPALEPSIEAVGVLREQLHRMGFLVGDDVARGLLRSVLAVEAARLDRRARDAATECLRSIQQAAREALEILTQGPAPAAAPGATPPTAPMAAIPRDESLNLAEVVRRRLGEEMPRDTRPMRFDEPGAAAPPPPAPPMPSPPPPPAAQSRPSNPFSAEPRRPVFKHPRRR
ncbi:MAG TPA: hypothetical protein VFW66_04210 [Gemmatimonadales bacterium]|nr:hypothetical protein [Gemmatimonadales bacterium]